MAYPTNPSYKPTSGNDDGALLDGQAYRLPSGEVTYRDTNSVPFTGMAQDYAHRVPEYFHEGHQQWDQGVDQIRHPQSVFDPSMGTVNAGMGALGEALSPVSAAFDTTMGRAIDSATHGRIPTRMGGTMASIATPIGAESAIAGLSKLNREGKLASEAGQMHPAFKALQDLAKHIGIPMDAGHEKQMMAVLDALKSKFGNLGEETIHARPPAHPQSLPPMISRHPGPEIAPVRAVSPHEKEFERLRALRDTTAPE
jgi:hypothetical protein